jgi:hypothetical protein
LSDGSIHENVKFPLNLYKEGTGAFYRVPTVWKSFGIPKKNSRALKRFGIL